MTLINLPSQNNGLVKKKRKTSTILYLVEHLLCDFFDDQRGEDTDASVDLALPPTVIHPALLVLAQDLDQLTLGEGQFLIARCLVVVQSLGPHTR